MLYQLWGKGPHITVADVDRSYTVVYIHGAGHCGSTLLNLLLNAHSQVVGISEFSTIHNILSDKPEKSEAKEILESDFWKSVIIQFQHRFGEPLLSDKNLTKLTDWSEYLSWGKQANHHFQSVSRALFDSIAEVSGARLICDASKFLLPLHLLISSGLPAKVIHLHRDGRAVIQSYLRKGRSFEASFVRWGSAEIGYLLLSHWLPSNDVLYCRYEELAVCPERELRRICAFLGLDYEARMLTEFPTIEQVGIGGNRMRFSASADIALDEAWKRELSLKSRILFWWKGGWIQWPLSLWAALKGH